MLWSSVSVTMDFKFNNFIAAVNDLLIDWLKVEIERLPDRTPTGQFIFDFNIVACGRYNKF